MSLLIIIEVNNCLTVFDVYCKMKRFVTSNYVEIWFSRVSVEIRLVWTPNMTQRKLSFPRGVRYAYGKMNLTKEFG